MQSRRFALALLTTLSAATAVFAARGDDRSRADALLVRLAGAPKPIAPEAIERAKDALRRSDEARSGGDTAHAALLDALGLEWAETAEDLGRATAAEQKLAETQNQISDTEQKLTRAKALLDDTVARRGRAEHKLQELEQRDGGGP